MNANTISVHLHLNEKIHQNELGVSKRHDSEDHSEECLILLSAHLDCWHKKKKKTSNVVFGHATLQFSRKSITILKTAKTVVSLSDVCA